MSTPAATKEWRWIPVYQRTDPTMPTKTLWSGATSYAFLRDPQEPDADTTWTAADVRGGYTGAQITGLGAGVWHVYAKVTNPPDTPVVDCGLLVIG